MFQQFRNFDRGHIHYIVSREGVFRLHGQRQERIGDIGMLWQCLWVLWLLPVLLAFGCERGRQPRTDEPEEPTRQTQPSLTASVPSLDSGQPATTIEVPVPEGADVQRIDGVVLVTPGQLEERAARAALDYLREKGVDVTPCTHARVWREGNRLEVSLIEYTGKPRFGGFDHTLYLSLPSLRVVEHQQGQ